MASRAAPVRKKYVAGSGRAASASGDRFMDIVSDDSLVLLARAREGDALALGDLFEGYRERLSLMVRLRMDPRLQARVDPADVLQDTYLDVHRRFADYASQPSMPFFLWLRWLTAQRLVDLHRRHLGAKARDAGQEVSLFQGALPQASSVSLAAQLMGKLTSASKVLMRAETQLRVQHALNRLEPIDREVLSLRHFELLTNDETASELRIGKKAASNRYVRALRRLKELLGEELEA
jgi:RNA polymerase sigma-70 factor (ECF subfamily)